MSKHTPGPWMQGKALTDMSVYHPLTGNKLASTRTSADAQLMAASPDLLAVCKDLVAQWDMWNDSRGRRGTFSPPINAARAAIAKAEGRE